MLLKTFLSLCADDVIITIYKDVSKTDTPDIVLLDCGKAVALLSKKETPLNKKVKAICHTFLSVCVVV